MYRENYGSIEKVKGGFLVSTTVPKKDAKDEFDYETERTVCMTYEEARAELDNYFSKL